MASPDHNGDLPDLRAQFVRTVFVEQYLPKLANGGRVSLPAAHRALQEPGRAEYRKAQIYVMVYLKRDSWMVTGLCFGRAGGI